MRADLYWIHGPWPGKLAIAPRPRGGDWLADEIGAWRRADIKTVLSLLTPPEQQSLDLSEEPAEAVSQGIAFRSLPIEDRQTPTNAAEVSKAIEELTRDLAHGKNVLIHCRQGIGRAGLIAACLLVNAGQSPDEAMATVTAARRVPIPETAAQRDWIIHYAAAPARSSSTP